MQAISEREAGVKFGHRIKATRLGWRWSPHNGGWLRLSWEHIAGQELLAVELAPLNGIPPRHTKSREHVVWWNNPACLSECVELRSIRRVKRYFRFYVD